MYVDTRNLVKFPLESCSAQEKEKILIGPGSSQNRTKDTPYVVVPALIFPQQPQTVVALYQNTSPVGEKGGLLSVKPIGVRCAAIAGCQETPDVSSKKLPLCGTVSHPAVQAVGLAAVVPVAQHFVTRELNNNFRFPGRSREYRPMRLLQHRGESTLTSTRIVSGALLHLTSLKRNRKVVLG